MWSKLIETPVGYHSENIMRRNKCGYHNWDHIISMFDYLEKDNYPYDIQLDAAILFHDSVYDQRPDKEVASAELFLDYCEMYPNYYNDILTNDVFLLILDTIDHKIGKNSSKTSKAIIRADLHGLADGETTFVNYYKIMNESMQIYNIDKKTFAQNNIKFMIELRDRISKNNLIIDTEYTDFWKQVICGIDDTISMSNIILR
jgi:predicted metal-dependent HD superfamily phosphohydrolase